MSNKKDHIEMALKAAESFTSGGKLDARELSEIIDIAERDGIIDQNEVRVLRSTISRIEPSEVDSELRRKLGALMEKISNS